MTAVVEPGGAPCVRQAERADLLAVHRIEQSAFPQPWPFGAFEQHLGEPGFLVAEDRGVIGYVVANAVSDHGRPLGHIKDIAVGESRRSEGAGSRLLEQRGLAGVVDVLVQRRPHALAGDALERRDLGVLDARGVGPVKLEVRESNGRAQSLYRRHGFAHRRTVSQYYSDGENALVFVRDG